MYQETGKMKMIGATQKVSEKAQFREFVITIGSHRTGYGDEHILFKLWDDNCRLLTNFKEGGHVTVHFYLKGREWNGPQGTKYFNTLEACKIDLVK